VTLTELLWNCAEWSDGDVEREGTALERADEAPMGELLLNVGPNILRTLIGRRMVSGCTGRVGRTNHPNVPTVDNSFDDGNQVPVVMKEGGPCHRMEVGGNGDTKSILICNAGGGHLVNELNTLSDEVGARPKQHVATGTWRRQSGGVVTEGSDIVEDDIIDDLRKRHISKDIAKVTKIDRFT
jgi:hypothetical protein